MEKTVNEQLMLFGFALLFGMMLGVVNDLFRFIRFLGFDTKKAVFFQDILFMCLCAFATFLFSLAYNQGEIRFFTLFGEFLGIVIYRYTIGIITGKVFSGLVYVLKKIKTCIVMVYQFNVRIILFIFHPIFGEKSIFRRIFKKNMKKSCKRSNFWCIMKKDIQSYTNKRVRREKNGSKRNKNRKIKA